MIILGTNSIKDTGGYQVANSLRFNGGSSDYLNRTNATPTNQLIWTYSFWVKLSDITDSQGDGNQMLLSDYGSSSNRGAIFFESDDTLRIADRVSNSFTFEYRTTRLFRDPSAWYHIVVNHNRTLSTPVTKVYVNGVQETSFSTSTNPSQNGTSYFNVDGQASYVGKYGGGNEYYNGYISEAVWIDGQALDADSFGEFDEDSGIWKPIDGLADDLTFGDNGFYLEFKQSGTGTNASGMGADTSGEDNHFAVNNLTAVDQSTDTCTNNFATLNPLSGAAGGGASLTQGNLELNGNASDDGFKGTIGVTSGKWYWEIKAVEASNGSDRILVATENVRQIDSATDANSEGIYGIQSNGSGNNMNSYTNGTFANNNTLQGYDDGAIISVALDMDNHELYFAVNGTYKNLANSASDPAARTNPMFSSLPSDGTFMLPYVENRVSNATPSSIANFGSSSYANSSSATDGRVHGDFEYAPPSGFFALCSKNLGEFG